jgi:hypothetical protein
MSIEQHQDFHIVRRIIRSFAPEYRLLATANLKPGEYVLDSARKTIEVAEGTEIHEAVAKMLFLMGHIALEDTPLFAPLFGKHLVNHKGKEADLVLALAELGCQADLLAAQSAIKILTSFWDIPLDEAHQLVDGCRMAQEEWRQYFS